MNLLVLVQTLHYEAKLPGDPPSAVTGLTGRSADLLRWTIQAYKDIQLERNGKWKWLQGNFYVDTAASDADYAYTECTDTDDAVAISRFKSWFLDKRDPPMIYLSSDGVATERDLAIADWPMFRRLYVRGSPDSGYPGHVCADVGDVLQLGPTPDAVYRVTGKYWKSVQTLDSSDPDDTPEMPSDFHMLIPYRALVKYAYNIAGPEVLARAKSEGGIMYNNLSEDQAFSMFSWSVADALA